MGAVHARVEGGTAIRGPKFKGRVWTDIKRLAARKVFQRASDKEAGRPAGASGRPLPRSGLEGGSVAQPPTGALGARKHRENHCVQRCPRPSSLQLEFLFLTLEFNLGEQ